MKKILAFALMMAVLVCPVLASGEPAATTQTAAAEATTDTVVMKAPTCTEAGYGAEYNVESGDILRTYVIPATGHNYEYQYDATRNADGSFATYGTWQCTNCGDVKEATEGNAVYYYGELEKEQAAAAPAAPAASGEPAASAEPAPAAPAADASAEPAASGEPSADASAEAAPAEEAVVTVANPNYNPNGYNWNSIAIVLALVIIVVCAILMLSFGKKKS